MKSIKKIIGEFRNRNIQLQENKYISLLNQIICTSPHKLKMAQYILKEISPQFNLPQTLHIRPHQT